MTGHIIVASNAVGPECRAGHGGTCSPARQRASGMARSHNAGRIARDLGHCACSRVKGWLGAVHRNTGQPARSNFTRPHGAGGRLAARFEPSKQPRGCFANRFHLLRVRVRQHDEQSSTRMETSAWESHPRIRSNRKCLT